MVQYMIQNLQIKLELLDNKYVKVAKLLLKAQIQNHGFIDKKSKEQLTSIQN